MTVAGLLTGVVIFSLGNYYQENVSSAKRTTQDTDTRSTLRSIENEISNSAGFLTDLTVLNVPFGSNNIIAPWSYKGNDPAKPNNRVLMANVYATDKARTDDSRMPVFINTLGSCNPDIATPAKNALVYFAAKDSTTNLYNLYRRTIVNTSGGTLCGTIYQKQTCAATLVTSYPSVCKASDAIIMSDIESFTVDYFASSNDASPIADQYTIAAPSAIQTAKTIRITVVTNRLIDGVRTANTASIRISRPY